MRKTALSQIGTKMESLPLNRREFLKRTLLSAAICGAFPGLAKSVKSQAITPSSLDGALTHLAEQMDRFHKSFDVYTDAGSPGNHFVTIANFGSDLSAVEIDTCSSENPHSGLTSIKNTFRATSNENFGGVFFLNGVLTGEDRQPRVNFGDIPNTGVDLQGATQLTFWARGERGNEQVEFFMGGIGRRAEDGLATMPFPDSTARIPPLGVKFSLTTNWTMYTIDLSGANLSYVLGGLGWACTAQNNPQGAIFHIDDIQYSKSRLDDPRLILSYVTISDQPFDVVHRNVAFTYDNVIAMLAFMARGTQDDWRRAKLIADALVYAQGHDRFYNDGRLRNAYQAGDLTLPPGWTPRGKIGVARLPSIIDCAEKRTTEDRLQVSTYTGVMAWAMLGLLTYFEKMGGAQYLEAARLIGEWIEDRRRTTGLGGYRGGFEGFDNPSPDNPNDPVEVPWASTEHNMDIFVAFTKMARATGAAMWRDRAAHAQRFVEAMWDSARGCFFAGTKDATTIDKDALLLDVQAWSVLTQPDASSKFPSVLKCAEMNHRTEKDGLTGFDFNDDRDGIWLEGTAHMALAYTKTGQTSKAGDVISQLRLAQSSARNSNASGIVAASRDNVTTGFALRDGAEPLLLFNRLHIGATGWYALAEMGMSPFALFDSRAPRITGAMVSGKKLMIFGENFETGAVILLNDKRQSTTNDSNNPTGKLISKKAGKKAKPGDILKVQNPDGTVSQGFTYVG